MVGSGYYDRLSRNLMSAEQLYSITLDKRALFTDALAKQGRWSCESNFNNVFMWAEAYDTRYATFAERLVVANPRVNALLFPFGTWLEPALLEEARQRLFGLLHLPLTWGDVPPEYIEAHAPALQKWYGITTTPDEDDYILRAASVAALEGHGHHNTRRLIRQFGDLMPGWRLSSIDDTNLAAVRAFAAAQLNAAKPSPFAADEARAMTRAFDNFAALGLEGLLITSAKGAPLAFSIFSFTTPDVCNVHFEKADREAAGAAQTIRVSLARHLCDRATWINLEQDMGNPGLRRSKSSYMPELMLPRYRLTPHGSMTNA